MASLNVFLGPKNLAGVFVRTVHWGFSEPLILVSLTARPTEYSTRNNPDLSLAHPALAPACRPKPGGLFHAGSHRRARDDGPRTAFHTVVTMRTTSRTSPALRPREHPPLPRSEGCERSNASILKARSNLTGSGPRRHQSSSTKPVPFRRSRPACQNRSPA